MGGHWEYIVTIIGEEGESIAHIQVDEGQWFPFAERLSELTGIPVQYPDQQE